MPILECPDCHAKREFSAKHIRIVMPTTEGRCVPCHDSWCGWMNDLWKKMTEDERKELDEIPDMKKVTEFLKEIERKYVDSNG
jgi:hypothetical protein